MAGIKNEKDKAVVAENTNSTETNVNKGFYTSEQLNKIENGMSNYEEIKENFIDLDEYSEDK